MGRSIRSGVQRGLRAVEGVAGARRAPAYAAGVGLLSTWLGLALQQEWSLPLLQVLGGSVFLWGNILVGRRRRAAFQVCLWGAGMAVAMLTATCAFPLASRNAVWHGEAYAVRIHSWILSGRGPDADPRVYVPQRGRDLGILVCASAVTGGVGGLAVGAVLLNDASFCAGALMREARRPLPATLLAWPPWVLLRAAGYLLLVVALTDLFYCRLGRQVVPAPRFWVVAGSGLLLASLDVLMQFLAGGAWQRMMAGLL